MGTCGPLRVQEAEGEEVKKQSKSVEKKIAARVEGQKLDPHLEDQFASGRLYACISSRPGQCGRCDGYGEGRREGERKGKEKLRIQKIPWICGSVGEIY